MSATQLQDIQRLAGQMARLSPRDSDQLALVGFMAGALYSLQRALQCGFDDRRMSLKFSDELPEQQQALIEIQGEQPPSQAWLSGFYLDSAMMRLSALNERVDKYLGSSNDVAKQVRQLVNCVKHDVDAGITNGWSLTLSDVLKSTEELCRLLEKAIV